MHTQLRKYSHITYCALTNSLIYYLSRFLNPLTLGLYPLTIYPLTNSFYPLTKKNSRYARFNFVLGVVKKLNTPLGGKHYLVDLSLFRLETSAGILLLLHFGIWWCWFCSPQRRISGLS